MAPPPAPAEDTPMSKALTVLGLSSHPKPTLKDVRGAYKRLSLIHHPDKSSDPDSQARFVLIKDAHDHLVEIMSDENADADADAGMRSSHHMNDVEVENAHGGFAQFSTPQKSAPQASVPMTDPAGRVYDIPVSLADSIREAQAKLAQLPTKRRRARTTKGSAKSKKTKVEEVPAEGANGGYTSQPSSGMNYSQPRAQPQPFPPASTGFSFQPDYSGGPEIPSDQHKTYTSPYGLHGFNPAFQNAQHRSPTGGGTYKPPGSSRSKQNLASSPPSQGPSSPTVPASPTAQPPNSTTPSYTFSQILANEQLRNAWVSASWARNKTDVLAEVSQARGTSGNVAANGGEAELEFVAGAFGRKMMAEFAQYDATGQAQRGNSGEGSAA